MFCIDLNGYFVRRDVGGHEDDVEDVTSQAHDMAAQEFAHEDQERSFVQELLSMEEKLISWLTRLALKEHKRKHVPSDKEMEWVKRIARFYYSFVLYFQAFFQRKKYHGSPFEVFVSHSGAVKNSYALPLANYLKRNGVNTFIDESIKVGTSCREEILYAALTCKHFWCVLSEDSIGRKWPMRELLIGYTRHIHEREDGFCLMIDCYENRRRPVGLWMDSVLSYAALQLFDEHGSLQPFPGSMQRARADESCDARYERIASLEPINGKAIVPLSPLTRSGKGGTYGSLCEFEHFPIEDLRWKITNARKIRLLNTWIPNLGSIADALIEALNSGAVLEILLLSPESPLGSARNRALEASSQPVPPDYLQRGVKWNLHEIDYIRKSVRIDPELIQSRVQVRYYSSMPSISVYQTDNTAYVGVFFHGRMSVNSPHLEVSDNSPFGKEALKEFDILWDCSTAATFEPCSSCHMS